MDLSLYPDPHQMLMLMSMLGYNPTTQQPAPCCIWNTKFLSRGTKDETVDARDGQLIQQHRHRHCADYHGCLEAEGKQLLELNITKLPFVSGPRLEI